MDGSRKPLIADHAPSSRLRVKIVDGIPFHPEAASALIAFDLTARRQILNRMRHAQLHAAMNPLKAEPEFLVIMEARIATLRVRYARHATSILVLNFLIDSATPSTGGFKVLAQKRLRLGAHSSGGLSAWHLRRIHALLSNPLQMVPTPDLLSDALIERKLLWATLFTSPPSRSASGSPDCFVRSELFPASALSPAPLKPLDALFSGLEVRRDESIGYRYDISSSARHDTLCDDRVRPGRGHDLPRDVLIMS